MVRWGEGKRSLVLCPIALSLLSLSLACDLTSDPHSLPVLSGGKGGRGRRLLLSSPRAARLGEQFHLRLGLLRAECSSCCLKWLLFPLPMRSTTRGVFPLFSGRICSESLAGKLTGASPRLVHPSLLNSPVHSSLASCGLVPTLLSALVSCDSLSTCQSLACGGSGCAVTSLL